MTLTVETPGSTGCRPRFATPRDERFPTHGTAIGEIARRFGRPPMPWQQEAYDVAGEYDPETGQLRYSEVDGTVPRQCGKTTMILAKKVHRLTVMARTLGPQRSTYTAQTRLKARQKLERDFSELLRSSRSFREITNAKARPQKATEWRLSLNNGSEAIQFGSGSFLQIDAPSRTGGHGDTLDDGTIDEAFSQEDDTVEAGMRPAMATRRNAQLWVISTAGDERSKYLWRKVLAGRAATESGQHGKVCYIEYSAPDDADPADPATWWSCIPALGLTITEDFIRGEWERAQRKGPEGIDTFRRAYLNQWPQVPVLGDEAGAVALPGWGELADPVPSLGATPVFAVAAAEDGSFACVSVASRRRDGLVQLQTAEQAPGTAWLKQAVSDLRRLHRARVLVHTSLRGVVDGTEVGPTDYERACKVLQDHVEGQRLRHHGAADTGLQGAVAAARWSGSPRRLTGSGGRDICQLQGAAVALFGMKRAAAPAPPPIADAPQASGASETAFLSSAAF